LTPVERPQFSYRADKNVPCFPDDHALILFDGHCVLCSRFARFVLKWDHRFVFRLAAAQSPLGQALYRHYGLDPVAFETNVLIAEGRAWFKSRGTIRMFERLGGPWRLVAVLRLVPPSLLDRLYDWIAGNRLQWWGRSEQCLLVEPAHADRFLS
jgi:predicted DCC family thiol-disulfide oxidoreductase YuxK